MFTLNCKGRLLSFKDPLVMGIVNTTPDSFYPGSRAENMNDILSRVEAMVIEGAAIIDIGGQSTRPGSVPIPVEEELARVIPAIEAVHQRFPEQIISIDTYYSRVVKEAVGAGASIVNDVSAGTMDQELVPLVASLQVPYILMHMQGKPQSMQENPVYKNVTTEVFDFLSFKIADLTSLGINDIIIDVGFGFGKTRAHNFQLLRELSFFKELGKPVLAGLSRKGTVYKTLGITSAAALNGTTVVNTMALLNGAHILRVHDVKEAMQAVKLYLAYNDKEQ